MDAEVTAIASIKLLKNFVFIVILDGNSCDFQLCSYWKSLGAKSFRSRRHVSHSCAVPGEEK
jgi:hypothetical protein